MKNCAAADFSGKWDKDFAYVYPAIAKEQSWLFAIYAGIPFGGPPNIQTHVATSLSSAFNNVIPLWNSWKK